MIWLKVGGRAVEEGEKDRNCGSSVDRPVRGCEDCLGWALSVERRRCLDRRVDTVRVA